MCTHSSLSPNVSRAIADCRQALLRRATCVVGRTDAEDLVQDTIERALRNLDKFVAGTNVQAWTHRIMMNLAADRWRRGKRGAGTTIDPETLAAPAAEERPEWETLSREQVRAAVRALSPRLRQVFELHYEWGLDTRKLPESCGYLSAPWVRDSIAPARN